MSALPVHAHYTCDAPTANNRYVADDLPARWLDLNAPLAKQLKQAAKKKKRSPSSSGSKLAANGSGGGGAVVVTLGVKFFVSHPGKLVGTDTRWYFFHQLLEDLRLEKMQVPSEALKQQMLALACQATLGDFNPAQHDFPSPPAIAMAAKREDTYLHFRGIVPPNTPPAALVKIQQVHNSLRGVPEEDAIFLFLRQAVQQETYGSEFFTGVRLAGAKDKTKVCVSVSCNGIRIYPHQDGGNGRGGGKSLIERSTRMFAFAWPEIGHISLKRANFKIVLRAARAGGKQLCVKFKMRSTDECTALWTLSVQRHTFHRRRRVPAERGVASPLRTEAEVLVRAQSRGSSRRPATARGQSPLMRTLPLDANNSSVMALSNATAASKRTDTRTNVNDTQVFDASVHRGSTPTKARPAVRLGPAGGGNWIDSDASTAQHEQHEQHEQHDHHQQDATAVGSKSAWWDEASAIMAAGESRPTSPLDDDDLPASPGPMDETMVTEASFLGEKSLLGGPEEERVGYQIKALFSYVPSSEDEVAPPDHYQIVPVQVGMVFLCIDVTKAGVEPPGADWWLVEHPDHPGSIAAVPSVLGCSKIDLTLAFDSADFYDAVELVGSTPDIVRPVMLLGSLKGMVSNRLTEDYMDKYIAAVPYTTRAMRVEDGEEDGLDYHFVTHDAIHKMLEENAFCEVSKFNGNLYGTPYESIRAASNGYQCVVNTSHTNPASILSTISLLECIGKMFPIVIFLQEPDQQTLRSVEDDFTLPPDIATPSAAAVWQQVEHECSASFAQVVNCSGTTLSELTERVDAALVQATSKAVWVRAEGELPADHPLRRAAAGQNLNSNEPANDSLLHLQPPPSPSVARVAIPPPPPPPLSSSKPALVLDDGEDLQLSTAVDATEPAGIAAIEDGDTMNSSTVDDENSSGNDNYGNNENIDEFSSLADQIKTAANRRSSKDSDSRSGDTQVEKRGKKQPLRVDDDTLENELQKAVRRRSQQMPNDESVSNPAVEGRDPSSTNAMPLPSATWKPKPKAERDAEAAAAAAKIKKKAPRMSFEDEMAAAMKRRQTQLDSDSSDDGGGGGGGVISSAPPPPPPGEQYSPHRRSSSIEEAPADGEDDVIAKLKHAADMEDARLAAAAEVAASAPGQLPPQDNRNTALYLRRSQSLQMHHAEGSSADADVSPPAHPEKSLVSSWMGGVGGGGGGGGGKDATVDYVATSSTAAGSVEAAIKVGELHTELLVEFARGPSGYGFSFKGGTDCLEENSGDSNVYIATINGGGAADLDGRLRVGDRIIEANGTRLMEVKHDTVTEVLRSNLVHVKLKVLRATGDANDIAAAHQQQERFEQNQREQLQKRQSHYTDTYELPVADYQRQSEEAANNANRRDAGLAPPAPPAPEADWRMSSFGGYETPDEEAAGTAEESELEIMAEETIELEKNSKGSLGFTLAGGVGSKDGIQHILVARIIPLKPANIDGRLKVDDRIIEFNNTSFRGITQAEAIQAIKSSQGWVTIKIARRCQRVQISPMEGRYGIAISGGAQLDRALFVKKIQQGSAAASSDLQEGDEIYRLNGHQGMTLTKDEANTMIKASADGLELMIHRKL